VKAKGAIGTHMQPWVGDVDASNKFGPTLCLNYSPCLTRTRAGNKGYWLFRIRFC
jgi:hypothetical protein